MVPPKSRFVAYYRVSTAKQGRSGLGLEAQQATVREHLHRIGGVTLAAFTEVESGRKNERPELQKAILRCRQSNATLLVAKLDRLGRNAAFLMTLKDSGVHFEALDVPGANSMTVGVLALVAQNEAEAISKRTKDALAARRARGLPMGTPRNMSVWSKRGAREAGKVHHAAALKRAQELYAPAIAAAREAGHTSLRAIARHLNAETISTPRGKSWTATAVKNVLKLLKVD